MPHDLRLARLVFSCPREKLSRYQERSADSTNHGKTSLGLISSKEPTLVEHKVTFSTATCSSDIIKWLPFFAMRVLVSPFHFNYILSLFFYGGLESIFQTCNKLPSSSSMESRRLLVAQRRLYFRLYHQPIF